MKHNGRRAKLIIHCERLSEAQRRNLTRKLTECTQVDYAGDSIYIFARVPADTYSYIWYILERFDVEVE